MQIHFTMYITSSRHAWSILKENISLETEEVWCLSLRSNLDLIESKMIFKGTADSCLVHPRDIFRFGVATNASRLLLAHSHPSNENSPSVEDIKFTKKLIKLGQMMEIPIVDHLIITKSGYYSMADNNKF